MRDGRTMGRACRNFRKIIVIIVPTVVSWYRGIRGRGENAPAFCVSCQRVVRVRGCRPSLPDRQVYAARDILQVAGPGGKDIEKEEFDGNCDAEGVGADTV